MLGRIEDRSLSFDSIPFLIILGHIILAYVMRKGIQLMLINEFLTMIHMFLYKSRLSFMFLGSLTALTIMRLALVVLALSTP